MGFLSKIWDGAKKLVKKVVPIVSKVAPFIPGVGPVLGTVAAGVGSILGSGGSSAKTAAPSIWPGVINAVSSNVPALMQSYGSAQQQKTMIDQANIARRFNSAEAEKQRAWALGRHQESMRYGHQQAGRQMDFQERMANTAHQRQMADLKTAGLNPILAATGGAPSPGGASGGQAGFGGASAQGPMAQAIDQIGPALATAAQWKMLNANVQNINQQTKTSRAQEEVGKATAEREYANRDFLQARANREKQNVDLDDLVRRSEARNIDSRSVLNEYDVNRAKGESGYYKSTGSARWFVNFIKDIFGTMSSARGVR